MCYLLHRCIFQLYMTCNHHYYLHLSSLNSCLEGIIYTNFYLVHFEIYLLDSCCKPPIDRMFQSHNSYKRMPMLDWFFHQGKWCKCSLPNNRQRCTNCNRLMHLNQRWSYFQSGNFCRRQLHLHFDTVLHCSWCTQTPQHIDQLDS